LSPEVSEFTLVQTHPVIDCPDYTCELDEMRRGDDQMMIVHLKVHKFSPAIAKRLLDEWALLRSCVPCPLFAYGEEDDEKYAHFMRTLGFEPISFIPCTDGRSRRVFVSLRKHNAFQDHTKQFEHERSMECTDTVP
jgi:hypothetical protein